MTLGNTGMGWNTTALLDVFFSLLDIVSGAYSFDTMHCRHMYMSMSMSHLFV